MKTEKYIEQLKRLPLAGKHIIGRKEGDNIIVYQAFNTAIANYAVKNQQFGGNNYSFNRMSWIKPGFLWMMHRSGWAMKENQESILAISLSLSGFKEILSDATLSSFDNNFYQSEFEWQNELNKTEVRLQWDPDHDPFGNKQTRKAIQLGMKGNILNRYCTQWITKIEDITPYAKQAHEYVLSNNIEMLELPYEEVISLSDPILEKRICVSDS